MPRIGKVFKKVRKSRILNTKVEKLVEVRTDERRSASQMKIGDGIPADENNNNNSFFRIIDISLLSEAICRACQCSTCGSRELHIIDDVQRREGVVCNLQILCRSCQSNTPFMTSKLNGRIYEANMRFVYGLRCIGAGREAGNLLCAVMNMPSPPLRFDTMNQALLKAVQEVAENSMTEAAHAAVMENACNENEVYDGTDLSVSCDSTWMKRGHSSLHGVSTVISVDIGKVLDLQVMSKYCGVCSLHKVDKDRMKEEQWQEEHKIMCSRNYSGSSGGMEAAGMKLIFHRSVAKYGVRYVNYLGDGDSSSFKVVCDSRPYGDSCEIKKLECIGHIQKRMGGRLRKLVESYKGKVLSDGKKLGGKNRLTKKRIDSLQNYYGSAIRNNLGSVENMKKAIWATWFHYLSTDENPIHGLCSLSWCKFKKEEQAGKIYSHKNSLPKPVMEAIKPVYQALSQPNLLEKCIHGKTQNPNESFNCLIWKRCPKTSFASNLVVKIAAFDAVAVFNDGNVNRLKVIEKLGFTPGEYMQKEMRRIDDRRISFATIALEQLNKIARQHRRTNKREAEDKEDNDYSYGGF